MILVTLPNKIKKALKIHSKTVEKKMKGQQNSQDENQSIFNNYSVILQSTPKPETNKTQKNSKII